MAARLFKVSALSTKPNEEGGTMGFEGGCVTPFGGTTRATISGLWVLEVNARAVKILRGNKREWDMVHWERESTTEIVKEHTW